MPGQREHRFDDHGAADQPADIDAGHGDQRQRRRFQGMHQQDARRLQALGACHRDVIFLQRRDHVGAQHAHQHRPFAERQRQRRQDKTAQIADGVFAERHIAGRRQPSELNRKQIDQQDRREERGNRQHAESATGHEAVEGAAAAHRAGNRERNADRKCGEFSQQHQLDRHRQAFTHGLQHGLPGSERTAEIALQHMTEPAQIAPPDRLVEPHVMAQRRHLVGRRLVAEDDVSEIARQQRGDQEGQQRDRNQHRHQIQEPSRDESEHRGPIPATYRIRRSPRHRSSAGLSAWRWRSRNRCSGRSRTRSPRD